MTVDSVRPGHEPAPGELDTVTVPGSNAAETVLPQLTESRTIVLS